MENNGKEVCGRLKEIRRQVAEANGIPYEPAECHFEGECQGTCPTCEEELKWLSDAIVMKTESGEEVSVLVTSGADAPDSTSSVVFDDGSVSATGFLMLPEVDIVPYEPLTGDISDEPLGDDISNESLASDWIIDDVGDMTVGKEKEGEQESMIDYMTDL